MTRRRAVVTGLGAVSGLGCGTEEFWRSLEAGASCLKSYTHLPLKTSPWCWGGVVPEFDCTKYISPKQKKLMKVMSRDIQLSVVASKFAIQEAGLLEPGLDRSRIGISLGAGLINNDLDELSAGFVASSAEGKLVESRFGADGMAALPPLWMLKYLPNMPACHISIGYDLQGSSNTITTEAAAGLQGVGEGYYHIVRNGADHMVTGGVDSRVNTIGISKYVLWNLYPPSSGMPEDVFRPFDDSVSGILPGEAAAILILTEEEIARKRGMSVYGEVLGYASAPVYDYPPGETEDVEGRSLAMRQALRCAGLHAEDIDFLYAHGCGISKIDRCERRAILEVFGNKNPGLAVTCLKQQTGYTGCASGALETIAALMALKNRRLPKIYNWKGRAEGLHFAESGLEFKSAGKKINAMICATSLTGQAACLILGEYRNA